MPIGLFGLEKMVLIGLLHVVTVFYVVFCLIVVVLMLAFPWFSCYFLAGG